MIYVIKNEIMILFNQKVLVITKSVTLMTVVMITVVIGVTVMLITMFMTKVVMGSFSWL
jgi:hypothetical protein